LEERIEILEQKQDNGGSLTVKGEIGFLLESGLKEFMDHLNNRVNALNLLLAALNW